MTNYTIQILFFLLLLVLVSGCVSERPTPLSTETHDTSQGQSLSEPDNGTSDELSLANFAKKDFDGRDLTLGRLLEETNAYRRYYITYRSGELKISGIMNVPTGAGPFPVLILNHGYIDPAIYTNGRGLRREQDYFARNDYIVIHPDYRNHAESDKDENVEFNFRLGYAEDVINLIYAVKESDLPYFAKDKIGMLGHSMGGGVTMNILVTKPDLVQAASLYAPVSTDVIENFERWTVSRPETAARIINKYGEPDENPDFYAQLSPINYLDQLQTPIILHHGTADADVPITWSENLYQAATAADKDITYHVYPGGPHEFIDEWPLFMRRNLDFFDQYLK